MKKILLRVPRMLLVGCILLVLLAVSALAYLSASTGSLTNTFTSAGETDPTINETVTNPLTVKTDVYVDVGTPGYAVYVRAAIVVNWEDASGHIHATAPKEGTDYTIDLNAEADGPWFLGDDGFYYHKAMVDSNSTTAKLINSCTAITPGPDVYDENGNLETDYKLNVQLIAQTIQALGTTDAVDANGSPTPAVEDAWKVVTVDGNRNLTRKTTS